jgi:TRAP transporter TAXI family solute receptor
MPITDSILVTVFQRVKQMDRAYRRVHRHPLLHAILGAGRSWLLIFLLAIPLLVGGIFLMYDLRTQYTLLTGTPGGSAASLGQDLVNTLNRPTQWERLFHLNLVPDFSAVESCGSIDNLVQMNLGKAQLAFVEDGLPVHPDAQAECSLPIRPEGRPSTKKSGEGSRVRVMMPLYLSPLHVLAKKRIGLKDVRQLPAHIRAYQGPDGSATTYVSQLVLDHHGIAVERVGRDWDFHRAMQELRRGTIDAAFFVIALNNDDIQQALNGSDVVLLNLEGAKGLKVLAPYLEVVEIPAETYKSSTQDMITVAARTVLAASADLTPAEVYEMAAKLSPHLHHILKGIPLSELKTAGVPEFYYRLHEGALRYYTHNPPFFLNPHFAAGFGSYLSVIYVSYTVMMQLLRRYRVHRILNMLDHLVATSQVSEGTFSERFYRHERVIRRKAAQLLRRHRIKLDDFTIISEYHKSQLPQR